MCYSLINPFGYWTLFALVSNPNTLYNVIGVKTHLSVNLPQTVDQYQWSCDNLTLRAVTTYVLCCNLALSMSEMTRFLLWIGTYCISCVVQQTSGVKDLSSLVRYDNSC